MRSVILYITYMYMYVHASVSFTPSLPPLPPNSHPISPANEYSFCSHASGTPFRSHTATRSFSFSFSFSSHFHFLLFSSLTNNDPFLSDRRVVLISVSPVFFFNNYALQLFPFYTFLRLLESRSRRITNIWYTHGYSSCSSSRITYIYVCILTQFVFPSIIASNGATLSVWRFYGGGERWCCRWFNSALWTFFSFFFLFLLFLVAYFTLQSMYSKNEVVTARRVVVRFIT